ncbi:MAG: hypothetical protein ACXVA4_02545 [Ktedonobacterales bacterium]
MHASSEAIHHLAQSTHGSVIASPEGLAQSGVYEIHLRAADRETSSNGPESGGVGLSRGKSLCEASSMLDNRRYITNHQTTDSPLVKSGQG